MGGSTVRAILIVLVLVGGIAAGVIGGLYAAGGLGGDDDGAMNEADIGATRGTSTATAAGFVPGSLLFASNRTMLSLCVDGAGGLTVSDEQVATVAEALELAIASVPDPPNEYRERRVSRGCPAPSAMESLQSGLSRKGRLDEQDWTFGDLIIGQSGAPSEPSPHRMFVYFVSPDLYSQSFSAEPYFRATAETICEGDVCGGVTTALYVRSSATAEVLQTAFLRLLNLTPYEDNPEIDEQYRENCRLGTPDPWCEGLLAEESEPTE